MARRMRAGGMALVVVVVAAVAACLLDGAAALHLCTDRLFNDTQGRHSDGLPHLNKAEEATWMTLLPRRAGPRSEFDWLALYRSLSRRGGGGGVEQAEFLSPASLHDVRLDADGASMYWQGQQTNLEYLLYLDPDRLTWTFRKQAKLPTVGEPYGGWESPDGQLRGHFTGHYLSAAAHMWASTHNDALKEKMTKVVDILYSCQKNMNSGYLAAYPESMFDLYDQLAEAWSPYYTIHKIMQGLLDQYTLAGNPKGLEIVVWMTDYFSVRVKKLIQEYSIQRHWEAMNEETGGFNDVMYQLYAITKDQKHLTMAHLFDKPCFLGPLGLHDDDISGLHVNTHVPVLVGAQKRYELVGDQLYKEIATFFFDVVNSSHTFATGGTSTMEHWHDPKRLVDEIKISSNEETCATYNLLKVSRNLFRWTKEGKYADHYERLLINGIMGNQRGKEPGVMIYFLPMGPGRSKSISGMPTSGLPPNNPGGWGNPNATFWCCYGTGIESFSKLGDSIYFLEEGDLPGLYIIQYIPSTFDWKAAGLTVKQQAKPLSSTDSYFEVSLSVSSKGDARPANANVRIPSWTSADGAIATLNGQRLNLTSAGDFLSVTKLWGNDTLSLQFPITLRTEPIKDDREEYASIQAVLFGPHLLAGLTHGNQTVSSSNDSNAGLTPGVWEVDAPADASVAAWVTPVSHRSLNSQLVSLTQQRGGSSGDGKAFVLSVSIADGALTMQEAPASGSDACVHATFRAYSGAGAFDGSGRLQGRGVTLEPFDRPGMASVSLERAARPGCFVTAPTTSYLPGAKAQVSCRNTAAADDDTAFRLAASFTQAPSLRQYHPLSFAAKGTERNFLLEPLQSLQDEFYTVYFNVITNSSAV
uniref:Alpha-L-arabinofuranosidase B arabinose-binding domain-containing protein n=1 Tax=Oryza brachyantha TaxID=4533 RepID=J3MFT5_ORYBR